MASVRKKCMPTVQGLWETNQILSGKSKDHVHGGTHFLGRLNKIWLGCALYTNSIITATFYNLVIYDFITPFNSWETHTWQSGRVICAHTCISLWQKRIFEKFQKCLFWPKTCKKMQKKKVFLTGGDIVHSANSCQFQMESGNNMKVTIWDSK